MLIIYEGAMNQDSSSDDSATEKVIIKRKRKTRSIKEILAEKKRKEQSVETNHDPKLYTVCKREDTEKLDERNSKVLPTNIESLRFQLKNELNCQNVIEETKCNVIETDAELNIFKSESVEEGTCVKSEDLESESAHRTVIVESDYTQLRSSQVMKSDDIASDVTDVETCASVRYVQQELWQVGPESNEQFNHEQGHNNVHILYNEASDSDDCSVPSPGDDTDDSDFDPDFELNLSRKKRTKSERVHMRSKFASSGTFRKPEKVKSGCLLLEESKSVDPDADEPKSPANDKGHSTTWSDSNGECINNNAHLTSLEKSLKCTDLATSGTLVDAAVNITLINDTSTHTPQNIEDHIISQFRCDQCKVSFSHQIVYDAHMCQHDGKVFVYDCDICGNRYVKPKSALRHLKYHDKRTCKICGKTFVKPENLTLHNLSKHLHERPYKCEDCGKSFADKYYLQIHKKLKNPDTLKHECVVCEKRFHTPYKLQQHMSLHTGKRDFHCDVCNNSFVTKQRLQVHYRTHTDERPYACSICHRRFTQIGTRNYHQSRHSDPTARLGYVNDNKDHALQNVFSCDKCPMGFLNRSGLESHVLRSHETISDSQSDISGKTPNSTKTLRCECVICGKKFKQKYHLNKHMLVHTGSKPHKCEVCGKGFTSPYDVKRHMNVHNESNLCASVCVCTVCGKAFKLQQNLTRHMRIHTGMVSRAQNAQKAYTCDECGKQFLQSQHLDRHRNVHRHPRDKILPFICDVCGKQFAERHHLKRHGNVHAKNRV